MKGGQKTRNNENRRRTSRRNEAKKAGDEQTADNEKKSQPESREPERDRRAKRAREENQQLIAETQEPDAGGANRKLAETPHNKAEDQGTPDEENRKQTEKRVGARPGREKSGRGDEYGGRRHEQETRGATQNSTGPASDRQGE